VAEQVRADLALLEVGQEDAVDATRQQAREVRTGQSLVMNMPRLMLALLHLGICHSPLLVSVGIVARLGDADYAGNIARLALRVRGLAAVARATDEAAGATSAGSAVAGAEGGLTACVAAELARPLRLGSCRALPRTSFVRGDEPIGPSMTLPHCSHRGGAIFAFAA
jgi:hypothetical protein